MTDSIQIPCPSCLAANRVPRARVGEGPRCGKCKTPLLSGAPVELDDASFSSYLRRAELPVVVDLWAAWCGPCKQMAPQFAQAATQSKGRVLFGKLDTDAAPNTAGELGVQSIPTMVLFQSGREVARTSGAMTAPQILGWVAQNLPAT